MNSSQTMRGRASFVELSSPFALSATSQVPVAGKCLHASEIEMLDSLVLPGWPRYCKYSDVRQRPLKLAMLMMSHSSNSRPNNSEP